MKSKASTAASTDKTIAQLQSRIVDLETKVRFYEEQFNLLQHKRFGRSSEKPGRKPLPKDLPGEQIRYELPKSEQVCGCGHALHEIGEDTSEQPDIIPAQIKVIEHIRVKYACRQCDNGIKTAPEPAQPIEKSIASPGLLAHIAVARYTDALPLYRQEAIFKRLNIDINRTSMANRMIKTAQLSQPLLQRLIHYQLQQSIIQADETPVQVLNEPGRKAQSQSYMWLYQSGSSGVSPPVIIYDYQPGRSGLFAKNYLQDFKGQYLQTDGYSGYAQVCTPQSGIVSVGCRAHAWRKFDEVIKALKGKNVKPGKAHMALNTIAKLYAIEKQCKTMSAEQVPPKQLPDKAIHYALNQWTQLTCYIEDSHPEIDNNAAERRIKPFVIGRKNWLFSQTPNGAMASATLYSLIETAKANKTGAVCLYPLHSDRVTQAGASCRA